MIKALRVETTEADLAHHEAFLLAFALQEGNGGTLLPAKLDAAALTSVAGRLNVVGHGFGTRVHVGDQAPSLVLNTLAKQDAGPQHVEAVAPACPVNLLGNPVKGLGVGVRNGVLEEGQNLLAPVLHGREQDLEVRLQPLGDLGGIGVKSSGGFVLRQLVDGVEGLLQPVGVSQLGLVVQPHVPVEPLLLAQPGRTHVQDVLRLEPVAAHASLAGLLKPDADPLHAVVRHPDHVELVHHQGDTGHHQVGHLAVGAPHVGGHALDHAPVLVPGQPVDDGHLAAVLEHVDGLLVAHVCNDTTHLPVNLGLVNTQPLGERRLVVGLQLGDEVAGQHPDGLVVAPHVLSNSDEGLGEAAVGYEGATALRHAPVSQDAAQGLQERLRAVSAPVALHLGNQFGGSAPDGAVHVTDGLRPVFVQVANATTLGAGFGLHLIGRLNDEQVTLRPGAGHVPIWEVEDVGHLVTVEQWKLNRHCINSSNKPGRLFPVVGIAPGFASCERPSHRVGGLQAGAHQAATQGRGLQAEPMQPKVRPAAFDGAQHRFDCGDVAISLTNTTNSDPCILGQSVAVHLNVADVVGGVVALQDGHDVDAGSVTRHEGVVALHGEPLVLAHRQASLLDHEGLAHVVLGDGGQQVAILGPAAYLTGVLIDRMGVAAMGVNRGECPGVHYPVTDRKAAHPVPDAVDGDEGGVKVLGIGGLMKADEEAHLGHALANCGGSKNDCAAGGGVAVIAKHLHLRWLAILAGDEYCPVVQVHSQAKKHRQAQRVAIIAKRRPPVTVRLNRVQRNLSVTHFTTPVLGYSCGLGRQLQQFTVAHNELFSTRLSGARLCHRLILSTRYSVYPKIDTQTALSFSGGRTSAYMLWRVLQSNGGKLPDGVEVCFANTGKEDDRTLEFVRDVGLHWNVPIRWIEYRDNEPGYALVDFDTASRNGEPFAALIAKRQYLPNPVTRFCTVELKIRAMHKHLKSLGWKDGDGWQQMVGIRADEPRRIAKIRARPSPETSKETMIMPLADAGVTKRIVGNFWREQPFDLALFNDNGTTPEGNCDLCFLKGANRVFTLIKAKPQRAIWWAAQESLSLSSKPSGASFRSDRPSYQQMHDYALAQTDMFDADDESIACFCGD